MMNVKQKPKKKSLPKAWNKIYTYISLISQATDSETFRNDTNKIIYIVKTRESFRKFPGIKKKQSNHTGDITR